MPTSGSHGEFTEHLFSCHPCGVRTSGDKTQETAFLTTRAKFEKPSCHPVLLECPLFRSPSPHPLNSCLCPFHQSEFSFLWVLMIFFPSKFHLVLCIRAALLPNYFSIPGGWKPYVTHICMLHTPLCIIRTQTMFTEWMVVQTFIVSSKLLGIGFFLLTTRYAWFICDVSLSYSCLSTFSWYNHSLWP